MGELVPALAPVLAGVGVGRAEGDLVLTELALVAWPATTLVLPDLVEAGRVVLAQVRQAVVHVQLAAYASEPPRTFAPAHTQPSHISWV